MTMCCYESSVVLSTAASRDAISVTVTSARTGCWRCLMMSDGHLHMGYERPRRDAKVTFWLTDGYVL